MSIFRLIQKQQLKTLNILKLTKLVSSTTLTASFMSLGGLPPLIGFFPKLIVLSITPNQFYLLIFVIILTSIISLFIYTRILYPSLITKAIKHRPLGFSIKIRSLLNILGLIPLIFFLHL
jgi:NADH:ubiquinone oxidoreductase subunit 2 (subunit N)